METNWLGKMKGGRERSSLRTSAGVMPPSASLDSANLLGCSEVPFFRYRTRGASQQVRQWRQLPEETGFKKK